jgi:hypothetical protein
MPISIPGPSVRRSTIAVPFHRMGLNTINECLGQETSRISPEIGVLSLTIKKSG